MSNTVTRTVGPETTATGPGAPPGDPPGYELFEEIGRGGMGVVYRARDEALGRDVAVKVLADRYASDSPAAVRFLNEARITGQLQHPGIPAVHQVGTLADGRPFLAMKFVKGQTLEAILKYREAASTDRGQLVAVFEAVCQAVGYAHAHQVIHRDLKPANIMVGAFGEVQVMDWGLAKVLGEQAPTHADPTEAELTRTWTQVSPMPDSASYTQAGSLVGTPAFIAPEQAMGEVEKVDAQSDVFGLGALLVVILTGKPPYVGETAEAVRVQAARGKLDDCFARLDASGAERELLILCKKCLSFEPGDRPSNAGELAKAVAELRAAADERARRAELDRVRIEGERATAEAKSAERRKRRRLGISAAAILALAVVVGLAAVVVVQRRANVELAAEQAKVEARNKELADEQAKVEARNKELAEEQAKVQARFDTAVKAIDTLHSGVSEDALLKNPQFKELRTKLLKEAAGFYAELEKLLTGQTDARSRKTLADGYFQLAELTAKIGDQTQALALHRTALAVRRELAAESEEDAGSRLDVARSLWATGRLLVKMGNAAEARLASEECRDLAGRLETLAPTEAVRSVLAHAHYDIGTALAMTLKYQEALEAYRKASAIYQKLADANPGVDQFRLLLADAYTRMGGMLAQMNQTTDGLESLRKASDIMQKLVDANPGNIDVLQYLAANYDRIAMTQLYMGKPAGALEANRKALAIFQRLVDDNPAVIDFQFRLALSYNTSGWCLLNMGKPVDGVEASRKALDIMQKLIDDNPANTRFQSDLANFQTNIGRGLDRQKRFAEALTALDAGLALRQKLARAEPNNAFYSRALGESHTVRGGARARAGQRAEAATDLRLALVQWARLQHLEIEVQIDRSRALALLAGLGADAKSGVTEDEAKAFADQSVAALAAVVKAGWALPSELKEPDFDALRGRPDFQKLVMEVEGKAKK